MSSEFTHVSIDDRAIAEKLQILYANLNRREVLTNTLYGRNFESLLILLESFYRNLLRPQKSVFVSVPNSANLKSRLPLSFLHKVDPLFRIVMGDHMFHGLILWLSDFNFELRLQVLPVYNSFLDPHVNPEPSGHAVTRMRQTLREFEFLSDNPFWRQRMQEHATYNTSVQTNQISMTPANNTGDNNVSANEVFNQLIAQNTRLRQQRNEARDLTRQLIDDNPHRAVNNDRSHSNASTSNEQRLVRENTNLSLQVNTLQRELEAARAARNPNCRSQTCGRRVTPCANITEDCPQYGQDVNWECITESDHWHARNGNCYSRRDLRHMRSINPDAELPDRSERIPREI